MRHKELDLVDWNLYVDYMDGWDEYTKDYQARLEDIPIEEIEKFIRKKKVLIKILLGVYLSLNCI